MWKQLDRLQEEFIRLGLENTLNYEKYFMYSLIYDSTRIEGSTLTENETIILLEKSITAKGKPLEHHLMVEDLYNAFIYVLELSKNKTPLTIPIIQNIGSLVMKRTGGISSCLAGTYDTSKGDLRKAQVFVTNKTFPDYSKVERLLADFVSTVNDKIVVVNTNSDILKLSANVHYNFVNIHPFGDGNGRVSRLLMNYIQSYHNKPMIRIFSDDRKEYIEALQLADEKNDNTLFSNFICQQQIKHYSLEIKKHTQKSNGFTMMF